jgi:hypothetical protein
MSAGNLTFRPTERAKRALTALSVVAATIFIHDNARGAGGAYAVDTADVGDPGGCRVESWLSWASNQDVIAASNPSCVVNILRPVELSAQFSRARADGEWASGLSPKAKTNIVPTAIGTFGLAVSAAASFDLMTRENTAVAVTAPATLRLSENMRINLNGGWLWDRSADRHYVTYGAGFDARTPDNVFTVTAEVFGQAGSAETFGVTQPRFQAGLRYRPVDRFSVDLIYGRNLAGENANWITIATIVRFPQPGK